MTRTISGELIQGFETIRTRKDGSTVQVSISKWIVQSLDGSVIGIASITRDISQTKEALSRNLARDDE
jgi:PAS domain S-box-containing protein